ncbi:hypothetical protein ACO0RG_000483 [Hanseniaspora osmophila]|uniref:Arp2/3 complex 34 kDa subunit n=1 Tax=Hanseniaspora osmophila TaxID=56408 RepID=A0A1E5R1Z1_9ASCO|nr:Actin-related protein 2/3 complex subunit 2 [Hanseniaspora osmophila]
MLHLPSNNLLLQKTINEAIEAYAQGKPIILDRIVSDFDHTTFHVSTPETNNGDIDREQLLLSITTRAWASILNTTNATLPKLQEFLLAKLQLPANVASLPQQVEQGYDFTVALNLSALAVEHLDTLSLLKVYILSYPFQFAIEEFVQLSNAIVDEAEEGIKQSEKIYRIDYRNDESFYIRSSSDRITVCFQTTFQDETDQIFGKVFIQEFVDSRKRNRSIQSSPQVLYSNEPPLEIKSEVKSLSPTKNNNNFITFVLFPRHLSNPELQFKTISTLCLFRNYFHYHIKCSKAYLHSRMRYRVGTFVKVLNRAKVEKADDESESAGTKKDLERRTFTGKKMVY